MVATFLSNWSLASRQPIDKWSASTVVLCCFLLGPVAALLLTAFGDSGGLWAHLVDTVLGTYVVNTLALMGGVGVVAVLFVFECGCRVLAAGKRRGRRRRRTVRYVRAP